MKEGEFHLWSLRHDEWKTTIQTRMHFNELIIRFRAFVLTAFVTLVGAVISVAEAAELGRLAISLLACLLLAFWQTAFFVDFFYYFRLLVGAVEHAAKWDEMESARKRGFYRLTAKLSQAVDRRIASLIVFAFYFFPLLLIEIALLALWKIAYV